MGLRKPLQKSRLEILVQPVADSHASHGQALAIGDASSQVLQRLTPLVYPLTVARAGEYHLWVRARWRDGCSNSVAVGLDPARLALVGNDGTYHVWHWVRGPVFTLQPGACTLYLAPREGGVRNWRAMLTGPMAHPSSASSLAARAFRPWRQRTSAGGASLALGTT